MLPIELTGFAPPVGQATCEDELGDIFFGKMVEREVLK